MGRTIINHSKGWQTNPAAYGNVYRDFYLTMTISSPSVLEQKVASVKSIHDIQQVLAAKVSS